MKKIKWFVASSLAAVALVVAAAQYTTGSFVLPSTLIYLASLTTNTAVTATPVPLPQGVPLVIITTVTPTNTATGISGTVAVGFNLWDGDANHNWTTTLPMSTLTTNVGTNVVTSRTTFAASVFDGMKWIRPDSAGHSNPTNMTVSVGYSFYQ